MTLSEFKVPVAENSLFRAEDYATDDPNYGYGVVYIKIVKKNLNESTPEQKTFTFKNTKKSNLTPNSESIYKNTFKDK